MKNMNKKRSLSVLCAALLLGSGHLMAEDVYNWRSERGVNTYSDVPRNLRPQSSNIVNVRTQTSRPAAAPPSQQQNQLPQIQGGQGEISAADLRAAANRVAEEEARKLEEENRKVREQNEATQASNCNVAKLNLQYAQTARVENRDQLVQQYQNNVNAYCK